LVRLFDPDLGFLNRSSLIFAFNGVKKAIKVLDINKKTGAPSVIIRNLKYILEIFLV